MNNLVRPCLILFLILCGLPDWVGAQQPRFTRANEALGIEGLAGGSAAWVDFDNDGLLDLFFTTVYAVGSGGIRNYPVLYHNQGEWKFSNVTAAEGIPNVPPTYQSAWADYDNDGDLDLVSAGHLMRNDGKVGNWLKVQLEGGEGIDRWAVGSQVRVNSGKKVITRQVCTATGQGNQNPRTLHFGLGDQTGFVNLEVRWRDKKPILLEAKPGQLLKIKLTTGQ